MCKEMLNQPQTCRASRSAALFFGPEKGLKRHVFISLRRVTEKQPLKLAAKARKSLMFNKESRSTTSLFSPTFFKKTTTKKEYSPTKREGWPYIFWGDQFLLLQNIFRIFHIVGVRYPCISDTYAKKCAFTRPYNSARTPPKKIPISAEIKKTCEK